jgi:2-polyprenyl-3-methyl-5-hydroxy-6-metoxy-1,4-benzoquinol methylase/predicted RNA-binding Zn-ribbon protein involved in translation (DUF1610 family)
MEKLDITVCPLCGKTHFSKMMTCKDHYATKEDFELYKCDDCGFRFTQRFPVENEIGRYYATSDYISHSDTRKGLMNKVYHYVRSVMLEKKKEIVCRCAGKQRGRLLDIGTGTGYFINRMHQDKWDVEAVEKNEDARNFALTHFGLKVCGDEALSEWKDSSFDVITLWHVMEHLQSINEVWQTFGRLLKDDGTLIIAVPNCSSADADFYKSFWAAYDVPRHLWHFSSETMKGLAQKHGFELKEILPMPFDAFYVSMLSEKYLGHHNTFLRGVWRGLLCWLQARNDKQKSSSLIYILKKNEEK